MCDHSIRVTSILEYIESASRCDHCLAIRWHGHLVHIKRSDVKHLGVRQSIMKYRYLATGVQLPCTEALMLYIMLYIYLYCSRKVLIQEINIFDVELFHEEEEEPYGNKRKTRCKDLIFVGILKGRQICC